MTAGRSRLATAASPAARRLPAFAAALLLVSGLLAPAAAPAADDVPGAVLRVGPQHALKTPSAAARLAADGDTVEIEAGDYRGDVAVWRQDRLRLRGVNGKAHLHADGKAAEGKAIWVIKGDDVTVEDIEFSGARVADHNGAGIRAEGAGLTIRRCSFHDNEMGILTSDNPVSLVMIVDSQFHHNTVDYERFGRLGHNIYIGRIARFLLQGSEVYGAETGHQVKSRARVNDLVDNRIRDGLGASSYLIDLPDGGRARIMHNELQQGLRAPNRVAIAFGAEGNRNAALGAALEVSDNRFRSDGTAAVFVKNHTDVPAVLRDNELSGRVRPLVGPGSVR